MNANGSFGPTEPKSHLSAPPQAVTPIRVWNDGGGATHAQRLPEFLQKDRPSLVPQKAVTDVRESQSRKCNIPVMFPDVKHFFLRLSLSRDMSDELTRHMSDFGFTRLP
jgi:hypothetical protein